MFYELCHFERFLNSCGIYLSEFERNLIKDLGTVYITCYRGTKNLNIRNSYLKLFNTVNLLD